MTVLVESLDVMVAFGLVWKDASPKSERHEAAALVRTHNASHRLRWAQAASLRLAVTRPAKAALEGRSKSAVLSGAALFAGKFATGNALLVIQVDSKHNRYALVAAVGGVPYLDAVVASGHVRERVASLKDEGHADFAEYGSHPDFPNAVAATLEELLGGARQAATMTKVAARNPFLLKGAILLGAVAIAGATMGWDYLEKKQEAPPVPGPSLDEAIAAYKRSQARALGDAGFSGDAALEAYWTPLAERHVAMAAWQVMKVRCIRNACTEEWGNGQGSYLDFIAQLPPEASYVMKANAAGADTILLKREIGARGAALAPAALPEKEGFLLGQKARAHGLALSADLLGESGLSYVLDPAKPIAVQGAQRPAAMPKGGTVERGVFKFDGPLGLLAESLASLPHNMAVDELAIDVSGGIDTAKFSVTGSYYVQN